MAKLESLGILGFETIHYYANDLARVRKLYHEVMDFTEVGKSGEAMEAEEGARSLFFQAGQVYVMVSEPTGAGRAKWFLGRHPDGIGKVDFRVKDAEKAFGLLEKRGATFFTDLVRDEGGKAVHFTITTPFGDTLFRFIQHEGDMPVHKGLETYAEPKGGKNRHGFGHVDHLTANFSTMMPGLLWMEQVLGFERFWGIEFHTLDASEGKMAHGSGLRSAVAWDPESGVKFANNEPMRPNFESSQIHVFIEDHGGDGFQHAALTCKDIIPTVRTMRELGATFMPTPGSYYDQLPERIKRVGINQIDEDIEELRDLQILVDGDENKSYLLQIFMKEGASLFGEKNGGPFFFEIIQRKGNQGFGAGNFRALFDSIERQQKAEGRI